MIAILFLIIGYGLHYLLSRAMITKPLWSRFPPWLDAWAMCSACSGAWTVPITAFAIGKWKGWAWAGLDATDPLYLISFAFLGMFFTPLLAWIHIEALTRTTGADYGTNSRTDAGPDDGPDRGFENEP